ncbi:hypothetical protein OG21DRAFT_1511809 [Imleria badia]|nr:hypothetical protein OG21DRAFT_1511809 [Imleria badia]
MRPSASRFPSVHAMHEMHAFGSRVSGIGAVSLNHGHQKDTGPVYQRPGLGYRISRDSPVSPAGCWRPCMMHHLKTSTDIKVILRKCLGAVRKPSTTGTSESNVALTRNLTVTAPGLQYVAHMDSTGSSQVFEPTAQCFVFKF